MSNNDAIWAKDNPLRLEEIKWEHDKLSGITADLTYEGCTVHTFYNSSNWDLCVKEIDWAFSDKSPIPLVQTLAVCYLFDTEMFNEKWFKHYQEQILETSYVNHMHDLLSGELAAACDSGRQPKERQFEFEYLNLAREAAYHRKAKSIY